MKAQKKSTYRMEVWFVGITTAGLVSIQGCAMLGSNFESGAENAGFRGTASTRTNPVPLPVEIVNDISRIAGGSAQQDGVWKPIYPEDVDVPAAKADANVAALPVSPSLSESAEPKAEAPPIAPPGTRAQIIPTPINVASGKRRRPASSKGKLQNYVVRSDDTLMKISFEKYGNVYRWREIYDTNRMKIQNPNQLVAGTVLNIQGVEYVVITRNGKPYLIRQGDTLVKISRAVYNRPEKWLSIWKNNPELIRDPNKIYAGFTLYYVSPDSKEQRVASPGIPATPPVSNAERIPSALVPPSSATPSEGAWTPAGP